MPRVTGRDAKNGRAARRPAAPRHDRRQHLRADDHPASSRVRSRGGPGAPRGRRAARHRHAAPGGDPRARPRATATLQRARHERIGPQAADGLSRGPAHVAPGARLRQEPARRLRVGPLRLRDGDPGRRPAAPRLGDAAWARRGARRRARAPCRRELPPGAQQRHPEGQPHPAARLRERRLRGVRRRARSARATRTASTGTTSPTPSARRRRGRGRRSGTRPPRASTSSSCATRTSPTRTATCSSTSGTSTASRSPSRWRAATSKRARVRRGLPQERREGAAIATARRTTQEWERCFETEARGLSCDGAGRDAKLARGRGRAPRRPRRREGRCALRRREPDALEPRPRNLVPGALRDDHALRHGRPRRLHGLSRRARWTAPRSRPPGARLRRRSPTRPRRRRRTARRASRRRRPAWPPTGPGPREVREGERLRQARAAGGLRRRPGRREGARARRGASSSAARISRSSRAAARSATWTARWPASSEALEAPATGYVGAAYP